MKFALQAKVAVLKRGWGGVLLLALLSALVFVPSAVPAEVMSGHNCVNGIDSWETSYIALNVTPCVISTTQLIGSRQYYVQYGNISWKGGANTINLAFEMPKTMPNSGLDRWQNVNHNTSYETCTITKVQQYNESNASYYNDTSYSCSTATETNAFPDWNDISSSIQHRSYVGNEYYGIDSISVATGSAYQLRLRFAKEDVPVGTEWKWGLVGWLSADTVAEAIANNRFNRLDPVINATAGNVTSNSDLNLTSSTAPFIDGKIIAGMGNRSNITAWDTFADGEWQNNPTWVQVNGTQNEVTGRTNRVELLAGGVLNLTTQTANPAQSGGSTNLLRDVNVSIPKSTGVVVSWWQRYPYNTLSENGGHAGVVFMTKRSVINFTYGSGDFCGVAAPDKCIQAGMFHNDIQSGGTRRYYVGTTGNLFGNKTTQSNGWVHFMWWFNWTHTRLIVNMTEGTSEDSGIMDDVWTSSETGGYFGFTHQSGSSTIAAASFANFTVANVTDEGLGQPFNLTPAILQTIIINSTVSVGEVKVTNQTLANRESKAQFYVFDVNHTNLKSVLEGDFSSLGTSIIGIGMNATLFPKDLYLASEFSSFLVEYSDVAPPTFSGNSSNASVIHYDDDVTYSVNFSDTGGLSWGFVESNVTGVVANVSVPLSGKAQNVTFNFTSGLKYGGSSLNWSYFTIIVNDSVGQENRSQPLLFSIANSLPSFSSASITPDPAYTSSTLTGSASGYSDRDGNGESGSAYVWFKNGQRIVGQTSTSLDSSQFVKSDSIIFQAMPSDGFDNGAAVNSTALVISNTVPSFSSASITPEPAFTASTLTGAASGYSDGDGDGESGSTYVWYKNGERIASQTAASLGSSNFVKGDSIIFQATPGDGSGFGSAVNSSAVAISNTAPPVPSIIFPTAGLVTRFNRVNFSSAGDDDGDAITYIVFVNGTRNGSSAVNYTFQAAPEKSLAVNVTAYDGANYSANSSQVIFMYDSLAPRINYTQFSDANGTFKNVNWIFMNYTWADVNNDTALVIRNGVNVTANLGSAHFFANMTGLADGNYSVSGWMNDTAGNVNQTVSMTVVVDTLPPNASFGSGTEASNSFVSRNWLVVNASVNETYVRNVSIVLWNSSYSNTTNSTAVFVQNFSGLANGAYQFNVTFFDLAGNRNTTSSRTATIDTSNPFIDFGLNSDANNSFAGRSWIFLNFSYAELNNDTFLIRNGSTNWTNVNAAASYFFYNFSNLGDGNYTFFGQVNDSASNINQTANRTVVIDLAFPRIDYVGNTEVNGSFVARSWVVVNVSVNETYVKNVSLVLWNGTHSNTTNATNAFVQNFSGLVDDTYEFNATVYDLAGNVNATVSRNVTVDTTPPNVDYGLNSDVNDSFKNVNWVFLNFSYVELNNHTFVVRNGSTDWTNVNASAAYFFYNFTGLNEGAYSFYGWVNDSAGNSNQTLNRTVVVDTTAPVVAYGKGAESHNAVVNRSWIFVNATVYEVNIKNVSIELWNSTGLVNRTNFTSSEGVADGINLTFSINFTSLPDAAYYFNATVYDLAGNSRQGSARTATVDTTSPSVAVSSIGGDGSAPYSTSDSTPSASIITNENADCRASLSDESYADMNDDVDCTGDGTASHACQFGSLSDSSSQEMHFACKDSVGNQNTADNNKDASAEIDTQAPTQSGWNPAKSSTIATASPTITFSTNEIGDCFASLSDESYASMSDNVDCAGDGTTSHTCAVSGLSEGSEVVYIACRDDTGASPNADSIATNEHVDYTVDTTPPNISIVVPAAGADIRGSFVVNVSINDSISTAFANLTLYNSTGNAAGLAVMSRGAGTAASGYWNASLDSAALLDGDYNVSVNATDSVGNTRISSNVSILVDNTPPLIGYGLNSDANSSFVGRDWVFLNFTWTEANNNSFTIHNRTADFSNVNATLGSFFFTFANLSDGNYTFFASMTDRAGSRNVTLNRTVVVDTTAPTLQIIAPANNSALQLSSNALNFVVGDLYRNNSWFRTVDDNGSVEIDNQSLTGFANTTFNVAAYHGYTLTLYANDKAGNKNSSSVTFRVNAPASSPSTDNSGGGGGGGSGGGAAVASAGGASSSRFYDVISPSSTTTMDVGNEGLSFTTASFTAEAVLLKVTITVAELDESKVSTPVSGNAYKYVTVEKTNAPDSEISSVRIEFKVEKSWFADNGYDDGAVFLNRYSGGEWASLPASRVSKASDEFFYYEVSSPGFSLFAITASLKKARPSQVLEGNESLAANSEEVEKPAEVRMPALVVAEDGSAESSLWFKLKYVALSAVVLAACGLLFYEKKFRTRLKVKKPAGKQKKNFASLLRKVVSAGRKGGRAFKKRRVLSLPKLPKFGVQGRVQALRQKVQEFAKRKVKRKKRKVKGKTGFFASLLSRKKPAKPVGIPATENAAKSEKASGIGVDMKRKFAEWPKSKQGRIEVEREAARQLCRVNRDFCVSGLMKNLETVYEGSIKSTQRRDIYQEIKEWVEADELCVKTRKDGEVQYYRFL